MNPDEVIVSWLKGDENPLHEFLRQSFDGTPLSLHQTSLLPRLQEAARQERALRLPDGSALSLDAAEQKLAEKEHRGPFSPLRNLLRGHSQLNDATWRADLLGLVADNIPASSETNPTSAILSDLRQACIDTMAGLTKVHIRSDEQWDWAWECNDPDGGFSQERLREALSQSRTLWMSAGGKPSEGLRYLRAPRALVGQVLKTADATLIPVSPIFGAPRAFRFLESACAALISTGAVQGVLSRACAISIILEVTKRNETRRRWAMTHLGIDLLFETAVAEARSQASSAEWRDASAEIFQANPHALARKAMRVPWPKESVEKITERQSNLCNAVNLVTGLQDHFGPIPTNNPAFWSALAERQGADLNTTMSAEPAADSSHVVNLIALIQR